MCAYDALNVSRTEMRGKMRKNANLADVFDAISLIIPVGKDGKDDD